MQKLNDNIKQNTFPNIVTRAQQVFWMKLKILPSDGSEHAALVSAVSWAGGCLASGGDDQQVQRWTSAGQASGQVSTAERGGEHV